MTKSDKPPHRSRVGRRHQRAALVVAAALSLGLLANIAIAWIASARLRSLGPEAGIGWERVDDFVWDLPPAPATGSGSDAGKGGEGDDEGDPQRLRFNRTTTRAITLISTRAAKAGLGGIQMYDNASSLGPPAEVIPRWQQRIAAPWVAELTPWPRGDASDGRSVRAAGVPLRALWCEMRATNAADYRSHTWSAPGGLILGSATFPGWADWPPQYPITLPCRPLWGGLALNTLLYAAAALLIMWLAILPRRARAHWRRRHTRCPRCGYDLSRTPDIATCPECGNPVPPAATAERAVCGVRGAAPGPSSTRSLKAPESPAAPGPSPASSPSPEGAPHPAPARAPDPPSDRPFHRASMVPIRCTP